MKGCASKGFQEILSAARQVVLSKGANVRGGSLSRPTCWKDAEIIPREQVAASDVVAKDRLSHRTIKVDLDHDHVVTDKKMAGQCVNAELNCNSR